MTVITGHVIPRVGYQRLGPQPGLGIEVATTDETRERAECAGPHRLDFHQIALVTAGFDDHEVDFVPYSCAPGTLLWIRPGQVQRGFPPPGLSGWLIWFTPDFPQLPTTDHLLRDPVRTVRRDLDKEEQSRLVTLITELHAESTATSPDAHLLRHLLAAVILRIRRLSAPADAPDPGHGGDIYTRFLQEIEGSYASTRQVEDYAARLGYTAPRPSPGHPWPPPDTPRNTSSTPASCSKPNVCSSTPTGPCCPSPPGSASPKPATSASSSPATQG
ncbi:AraC family ligand binding domain-containing protein [Streptomyces sp. NL15-2K]|uniref:AraC family ligand binding domain-containing protein n=1 Tax=Streptomyces sp. NL15-2K TaxID=376149 RepID=UPI000F568EEB|nr:MULTISPECIES: AraC family ligand binding domain-containing protein [Actinomycetes]WKX06099.1 AraC family ligand binding domain-containing protein [Kutzneria buriramensis]